MFYRKPYTNLESTNVDSVEAGKTCVRDLSIEHSPEFQALLLTGTSTLKQISRYFGIHCCTISEKLLYLNFIAKHVALLPILQLESIVDLFEKPDEWYTCKSDVRKGLNTTMYVIDSAKAQLTVVSGFTVYFTDNKLRNAACHYYSIKNLLVASPLQLNIYNNEKAVEFEGTTLISTAALDVVLIRNVVSVKKLS